MADTDGSVRLGVDLDIDGAKKDARSLGDTLKQMGGQLASAFRSADKAQQKAASTAAKANEAMKKQEIVLQSLKDKYDQFKSGDVAPKGLNRMETDARNAEKEFNKLCDRMDQARAKVDSLDFGLDTEQLRQARAELAGIEQEVALAGARADELKAKLEAARMNPEAAPDAQKLASEIGLAEEKLSRLKKESDAAAAAAEKLNKKFFDLPKYIKSAAAGIAGLGKKSLSVFGSIGGAIKKAFSRAGKDTNSFGKLATNMFSRLKGVILSAFIFNAVSKGLRELTSYLGSVISTNREFTNSLAVTKGNLLTAFQPILDVIMPALSTLGSGLVYVTGLLMQFVSLLTGKSIAQMQSSAKATNKQAQAIKNVGKEAKKARNELYPFDEIIKQTAENADGGGGGSGLDEHPVFEAPKFDMPAWIKEISLEIKAGNWEQAGKTLADALNGVVEKVDFDGLGEKIGMGLQKAFEFGLGFLRNIDTQSIGAGVAAIVNGIFGNLSGETFGASIGAFWNRVVDLVYGFVTKTDWSGIGKWLADAFNGLFKEFDFVKLGVTIGEFVKGVIALVSEFVLNTDWEEVGHSFWEVLTGIDWTGIVEDMALLLGRAIGGMGKLLWGFIKDAAADIGDYFHDEIEAAGGNIPLGLWNGIIKGLGNIGAWLWQHIGKPIVDGFCEMFGIHSPSTVFEAFGEYLIGGLVNGIKNTLSKITEIISSIKTMFTNGFKGIFNGIITIVENAINWIIGGLNKLSFSTPDWIPGIGGKHFGVNISKAKLPRLATGDVVQPNKEFLAVLGDNKTEQEVVSPLSTIREAVRAEMGGDELLSLLREMLDAVRAGKVVVFGRKEVGDFVIDELGRRARSSGKAVIPV